jgi:glucosyl-dolichyl phosphate glucuronosyltransferase
METPAISVVLPTRNRAGLLRDALTSLLAQRTGGAFSYEIVVVDNGSSDATPAVVQAAASSSRVPIRPLFEPRPGASTARNAGVAAAQGRWVAFIDDDEVAEPNWLARLLPVADEKNAAIVGGSVRSALPSGAELRISRVCRESVLRERDGTTYGSQVRRFRGRELPGCDNELVLRSLFDTVGMFDVSMDCGGADHDFALRVRRAGRPLWFTPHAVVHHRLPAARLTEDALRMSELCSGVTLAQLDLRHRGRLALLLVLAARTFQTLFATLPALALFGASGNRREILGRRCLLWRYAGYGRGTVALLGPPTCAQHEVFASLAAWRRAPG